MAKREPEISVLLPVHNAAGFLGDSLASLAAQREVAFEVVAVDDGSTDASPELLATAAREHGWLRVIRQERRGVAATLNRAWEASRAELVARLDADDVALPGRLRQQRDFLLAHTDVGVCGTWFEVFGAGAPRRVKTPVTDAAIRARLIFGNAFAHPSVMLRRSLVPPGERPYRHDEIGMEDYGFWLRVAGRTRLHNLPEVMLRYRRHAGQVTQAIDPARAVRCTQLRVAYLLQRGLTMNDSEAQAHAAVAIEPPNALAAPSDAVRAWLDRLKYAAATGQWSEGEALRGECADAWWRFARRPRAPLSAAEFWRGAPRPRDARALWRALRLAGHRPRLQTNAESS